MNEHDRDRPLLPARPGLIGLVALGCVAALTGCPGHLGAEFPDATAERGGSASGGSETGTGGTGGTGGEASDDGGTGSGGSSAPCNAPKMIFASSCAMSGCHGAGDFLDLSGNDPSTHLIGKPQVLSPSCAGMDLVNSTPPANGVLFKLLTGNTCGTQMPLPPYAALTMEQVDCVRDWIMSKL
jgi:hypothetical protein